MVCSHNYVYAQGYFVCIKCGKRSYGRSHQKKKTKTVGFGIASAIIAGTVLFLFAINVIEINQENIQKTIQHLPQEIKQTSETTKEIVIETSGKIKESIDKNLENSPIKTDDIPINKITETPKKIQESNPINQKPTIDTIELEKKIHLLINQQRQYNGLSALAWDDRLSNVARIHSEDMASRSYFSHYTPEGLDPTARGAKYGFKCEKTVGNLIYSGIAENIFQNNLYNRVWYTNGIPTSYEWNNMDDLAESTVSGWMESPGHRQNILTQTYDREGIGIAISSDDKVYITQNFC
jgi:uncharacterized protein YkwD